jgi:hypothetical protein
MTEPTGTLTRAGDNNHDQNVRGFQRTLMFERQSRQAGAGLMNTRECDARSKIRCFLCAGQRPLMAEPGPKLISKGNIRMTDEPLIAAGVRKA